MTLAVVVATGETTVLDRLLDQVRSLKIAEISLITRPDLAKRLGGDGITVVESDGVAGDLRELASIALGATESMLLLDGDLVASDELLLRLATGGKSEAAAVTGPLDGPATGPAVRTGRHLLDSAGSRHHQVTNPDGVFLGALFVTPPVYPVLMAAAEELAALTETPGALGEAEPAAQARDVAETLDVFVDTNVDGALGGSRRAR